MSDELLARLSGVPAVLGPPDTGDHVRPKGKRLTHILGYQRPVGHGAGEAWCGVDVWIGDQVADPATCPTCIRIQALHELFRHAYLEAREALQQTSKEEAMSDDMPRICVDCEWTDVQDLWEPVARRVLVRPCPQHTDMEEDQ